MKCYYPIFNIWLLNNKFVYYSILIIKNRNVMKKMLKSYLKTNFGDIKISKEMYKSIKDMFTKFMEGKESKELENDFDIFFDEMGFDIECELESWN